MKKMKELLLHVGMPKTGTTAIQNYLASSPEVAKAGYAYWDRASNHSGAFMKLFRKAEPDTGISGALDEFLAKSNKAILSAEVCWHFDEETLIAIRDYFSARNFETKVLCWIRPPLSYAASRIQQVAKTEGTTKLLSRTGVMRTINSYENRIASLKSVFGSCNFFPYGNPASGFSSVESFCRATNIPHVAGERERTNTSLSLTAVKWLLHLNSVCEDGRDPQVLRLKNRIRAIQGSKFVLPQRWIKNKVLQAEEDALRTIEEQTGVVFDESDVRIATGDYDPRVMTADDCKALFVALMAPEVKKEKQPNAARKRSMKSSIKEPGSQQSDENDRQGSRRQPRPSSPKKRAQISA